MSFRRAYQWIRFKIWPSSLQTKNNIFVEKASHHNATSSILGNVFKGEKWTKYSSSTLFNNYRKFLRKFTFFFSIVTLFFFILLNYSSYAICNPEYNIPYSSAWSLQDGDNYWTASLITVFQMFLVLTYELFFIAISSTVPDRLNYVMRRKNAEMDSSLPTSNSFSSFSPFNFSPNSTSYLWQNLFISNASIESARAIFRFTPFFYNVLTLRKYALLSSRSVASSSQTAPLVSLFTTLKIDNCWTFQYKAPSIRSFLMTKSHPYHFPVQNELFLKLIREIRWEKRLTPFQSSAFLSSLKTKPILASFQSSCLPSLIKQNFWLELMSPNFFIHTQKTLTPRPLSTNLNPHFLRVNFELSKEWLLHRYDPKRINTALMSFLKIRTEHLTFKKEQSPSLINKKFPSVIQEFFVNPLFSVNMKTLCERAKFLISYSPLFPSQNHQKISLLAKRKKPLRFSLKDFKNE
uniref:ccmFII n=1 Tax=Bakuella subtropica TaxID=1295181 RepID=UPI0023F1980B|nr:ccmFII [Bakuella subtropica]WDY80866.1 ccmFII [Bakuella subtropica]